jgi:hypothetical protein
MFREFRFHESTDKYARHTGYLIVGSSKGFDSDDVLPYHLDIPMRDLHDSTIVGLAYDNSSNELRINIRTDQNERLQLIFKGVFELQFSPFELQNVLYDFKVFEYNVVPDSVYSEYEVPNSYKELLIANKCKIALLNPSVGIGGFVIFKTLSFGSFESNS